MENKVRLKLDPRRGGVNPDDFLRTCFVISDWMSHEVEIWSSDDDGQTWDKLTDSDFKVSYKPSTKKLFVSLLSDIAGTTLLAFFEHEEPVVGVGYTSVKYDTVPIGWIVEGTGLHNVPIGFNCGSSGDSIVQVGFTIDGDLCINTPVGFTIKYPTMTNEPIGFSLAAPNDGGAGIGFNIGTVKVSSIGMGVTVLGLGEYPADLLPLDNPTKAAMSAEAAWHKQKEVTLNGTAPKELD